MKRRTIINESAYHTTTQHNNNTTTQQHNNTTTQQHNNTTTQQHNNNTTTQQQHIHFLLLFFVIVFWVEFTSVVFFR